MAKIRSTAVSRAAAAAAAAAAAVAVAAAAVYNCRCRVSILVREYRQQHVYTLMFNSFNLRASDCRLRA